MILSGCFLLEHPIDQTGYRPHPYRVPPTPMTVDRRQRLVATQPADRMFHANPPSRKRTVVAAILWRSLLPPRLASRRRPLQPHAQAVQTNVPQVPQRPHAGPDQLADQPRALQDLQVGPPPRPAFAYVHYPAVLVHGHLALERMRLLLARVVGLLPPLRPLRALLEGVHDHRQGGGGLQQGR